MISSNTLILGENGWGAYIGQEPTDENPIYTEEYTAMRGPVRVMVLSGVVRTQVGNNAFFGDKAEDKAAENPDAHTGINYELALIDLPGNPVVRLGVSREHVDRLGLKERGLFILGFKKVPDGMEPVAWQPEDSYV